MDKYKIYSGLGGGRGGPEYLGTFEYPSFKAAEEDAYLYAVEAYEGASGLMTIYDVEKYLHEICPEATEEDVREAYLEEMSHWLCYKAELVDNDPS